jgi:hypothetical protein
MLVVTATDQSDLNEIKVEHEIKNKGKAAEEHHFYISRSDIGGPSKKFHFVLDPEQARELKAHL